MGEGEISAGTHCFAGWRWQVKAGGHTGATLWAVLGGKGKMQIGQSEYTLRAGDVFLLRYEEELLAVQEEEAPLNVCFADFNPQAGGIFPGVGRLPVCRRFHGDFLGLLFKRLLSALYGNAPSGEKGGAEVWLRALLAEYACLPGREEAGFSESGYGEHIRSLCTRMRLHPEENFSVNEEARRLALNPDYFIRLFRKATGSTPYACLLEARLDAAKTLLLHSSVAVGQAAAACGFPDVYAFSRFFKKRTGVSPSAYRLQREPFCEESSNE